MEGRDGGEEREEEESCPERSAAGAVATAGHGRAGRELCQRPSSPCRLCGKTRSSVLEETTWGSLNVILGSSLRGNSNLNERIGVTYISQD